MNEAELERIKQRIAKLLAMAADSSSPNEAAIAASRARSLMDKYQISEADVSGQFNEKMREDDVTRKYTNIPTYMNILGVAIAKLNDCHAVRHVVIEGNKRYGQLRFRGFDTDVMLCAAMFKSLISQIDRLCKEYLVSQGITGRYPRDIGESFKIGCSSELCSRIRDLCSERQDLMDANEGDFSAGKGLVLVEKKKKVDEVYGEAKYQNTKHVAAYDGDTHRAREAGYAEGRKMEIQRKVEA